MEASVTQRRGALEICEEISEHEQIVTELKAELEELVGKPYDEFIAGMRLLMWPVDRPGYDVALQRHREQFGGAL